MLDSMAGMAAAMGSGGHGQPSAPTDSDSDSDLDGGDDSVVTMVDVRHSDLPFETKQCGVSNGYGLGAGVAGCV